MEDLDRVGASGVGKSHDRFQRRMNFLEEQVSPRDVLRARRARQKCRVSAIAIGSCPNSAFRARGALDLIETFVTRRRIYNLMDRSKRGGTRTAPSAATVGRSRPARRRGRPPRRSPTCTRRRTDGAGLWPRLSDWAPAEPQFGSSWHRGLTRLRAPSRMWEVQSRCRWTTRKVPSRLKAR